MHDALAKREAEGRQHNAVVLLEEAKVGAVGMLVWARVAAWREGGFRAIFDAIRPVRVTDLRRRGELIDVEVAPLTRPRSKVPRDEMDGIKADFNAFAKSNAEFRRSTKHPDYLNETVAAVDSPSVLTNLLLQAVPISAERRQVLLPLSDRERIEGLRSDIKAAR